MSNIDQLFSGMAKADINSSGTYMGDGVYEIETKSLFVKVGRNPAKPGDSFICEFTIVKSNNPAHAVGSTGSYVLKFSNPYAMGNIVELVMAILGYQNTKDNQSNPAIRKEVDLVTRASCGSDTAKGELGADYAPDMLTGVRLHLECAKKPTLKGGEFTVHKWSPIAAS